MESNKLLIGVQFIDESGAGAVIELIVLRDITFGQLLDGIKYGLLKKSSDDELFEVCFNIYDECINSIRNNGIFNKITLTSYNEVMHFDIDSNYRVILGRHHLKTKLCDMGFITSTKLVFDCTESYQSFEVNTKDIIPAFNPNNRNNTPITFPEYNISTRQMYKFDETPVEIVPPSEPPQKPEQNLFLMLLPTFLMVGSMILVRGLMAGNGMGGASMVLFSAVMSVATLTTTIINWIRSKKNYEKKLKNWREQYELYIKNTINEIHQRKDADAAKMRELYPDVEEILDPRNSDSGIYNVSGKIFSRTNGDEDFTAVRFGVSNDIKNMFEIKGSNKDIVFSAANFMCEGDNVRIFMIDDPGYIPTEDKRYYLTNLPKFVSDKYGHMLNAPLLFSMQKNGALGLVSPDEENSRYFIERMIFEMCFYQSPDDLQIVMLFPPTNDFNEIERQIEVYKFLPHFRGLFLNRSQFVFNSHSANSIFSIMMNIMGERAANKTGESNMPHIVFVVYEEYDMKEHAFSQYLPKVPADGKPFVNSLGITFVFPKRYKEHLPAYCNYIAYLNGSNAELVPHEDSNMKQGFYFGNINDWYRNMYNAYKILSALSYAKISEGGKVPSNVSLFELYGLSKDNINIEEFWEGRDGKRNSDIIESMGVPIGKTDNGLIMLDLHEKYDGPHMLVAGTTGSGKSETIITYLLGLCLCFRPDEVNLMLVDMKGGGFINRIGTLPHVVGSVTDVDGDENGTGAEYMLKRFLSALTSEIKRRKILFNSMHVDSINGYIEACRDITAHIENINNRLKGEGKDPMTYEETDALRRQATKEQLAHLILVVDEFTELKRFSTENNNVDFIGEITTIARVGRSLGLHIILISQNIEGAITEDIRVNSRARLCLKVATRQASKEMIGNDLAASPTMPGNGRGYLLVGTGSKFEYFQSGFSGASVEENIEIPVKIMEADKTGEYTQFYKSDKDNIEYIDRLNQLEREGKNQKQLDAVVGAIKTYFDRNSDRYVTPHIVFQRPLPEKMVYKNGIIYEYQDGTYNEVRRCDA